MKTVFSTLFILIIVITAGFAQQSPYETLRESIGADQVNPSVLFPLEIEGIKVTDAKVDYRFALEEGKSDLILSMDDFKSLESVVFKFDVTDRAKLIEAFDAGTSKGFTVDFEKNGPSNFCRLISNKQNPDEAYLLVGNENHAELLRIVYPKDSKKLIQSLKIKLESTLN
jgi:hypothetical protein